MTAHIQSTDCLITWLTFALYNLFSSQKPEDFLLKTLQWLYISLGVKVNFVIMDYKVLHDLGPTPHPEILWPTSVFLTFFSLTGLLHSWNIPAIFLLLCLCVGYALSIWKALLSIFPWLVPSLSSNHSLNFIIINETFTDNPT